MSIPATYTPGHSAAVTTFMARRTVESHAAFLLPHLRGDARVLDLGCGPGTITRGLAARVPRGSVLGLDLHAGQIAHARAQAAAAGLTNVAFEVATVETAALPEGAFDVVFAHAVFEHLAAPLEILRRLHRSLKPGGVIALRSPEWGGFVVDPATPAIRGALDAYERLQSRNGGNLRAGRKLGAWLEESGFDSVARSGSYEFYEPVEIIATYLAAQLEAAEQRGAGAALRAWAREPRALFAQAWFEAIGRKPLSFA